MPSLQVAAWIVSILAFIVSIVTLLSNLRQRRIDNLVSLQSFLHHPDLSEARRLIREGTKPINLEQAEVRRVCSSFDFAGSLVRHNAVAKHIFLDYWAIPIIAVANRIEPIGDTSTGPHFKCREYYRDFWWLIIEARKAHDRRCGQSNITVENKVTTT